MALALIIVVAAAIVTLNGSSPSTRSSPTVPQVPVPPAPTATSSIGRLPGFAFGFYSAGLRLSDCYGSCRPGEPGYNEQQADRQRMVELQAMHVDFVVNNESILRTFRRHPAAVLAYLDELHMHHIQISYSVASGTGIWFPHGKFDATQANRMFASTDLNGDGVSDLDGHLDALYQGHEVLEWATHDQRVMMYRFAKKWFPHTPVSVYYAGFDRPFDPAFADTHHAGGQGGQWRDYAYGPGEADIVHINVRRDASLTAVDRAGDRSGAFDPKAFHDAAARDVSLIRRLTPAAKIYISTNFAGDTQLSNNARAMWSTQDISAWYDALASIPDVDGVLLRSYGRFRYDLANPQFAAQRDTWRQLGTQAARINASRSPS